MFRELPLCLMSDPGTGWLLARSKKVKELLCPSAKELLRGFGAVACSCFGNDFKGVVALSI